MITAPTLTAAREPKNALSRRDTNSDDLSDVEICSADFAILCGRCTFTVQSWARSGAIKNCRKDPEHRQKWLSILSRQGFFFMVAFGIEYSRPTIFRGKTIEWD